MKRNRSAWLLVTLLAAVVSCGQDYNSNSGDEGLGGSAIPDASCSSVDPSPLCAAVSAIQSNCFGCHSSWKKYKTDEDWISSGLVQKGNSSGSKLVTRIINAGGDMPLAGTAIPQAQFDTIKSWIDQQNQ